MKSIMYQKLKDNDASHWWYKGRRAIIDSLIKSKINPTNNYQILDAGCGFGGNIVMLKKYGRVSAMDIDWEVIKDIDVDEKIVSRIPDELNNKYDLILLTDVLEHIEDDKSVAHWIRNSLQPGGYAVITVPAMNFLWSKMDEEVRHYRRYTKKNLLKLFQDKLKIVYCSYYNFFLFPAKLISKSDKVNAMTYKKMGRAGTILYGIMKAEAFLMKYINFPIGVSLILIIKNE